MTKCARCKEEIEGKAYDRGAHSPIYYCEDCYEDTPKVKCVNCGEVIEGEVNRKGYPPVPFCEECSDKVECRGVSLSKFL